MKVMNTFERMRLSVVTKLGCIINALSHQNHVGTEKRWKKQRGRKEKDRTGIKTTRVELSLSFAFDELCCSTVVCFSSIQTEQEGC